MINGSTPLHLAAQDSDRGDQEGRILAIKMLLDTGADPDIADSRGKLPFELSTNPDVREMLGGPAEVPKEEGGAAGGTPVRLIGFGPLRSISHLFRTQALASSLRQHSLKRVKVHDNSGLVLTMC